MIRFEWPPARIVGGTLYVAALVLVAALAAWPIYRSNWFLVVVGVAALAAAVVAAVSRLRSWSALLTAAVAAGATILLGALVLLATRPIGPAQVPTALGDALLGTVTGWKDLITVDLPVGTYRNLLMPAIVVFLVGTLVGLRFAWSRQPASAVAAVVCSGMVFFGLAFGRSVTSEPLALGPWTIRAPQETLIGAATLILSLVWLAWRSHNQRRQALRRAAVATGVRISRRRTASDRRGIVLAAGMLAVAAVAAAALGPLAAQGMTRDVLRSSTGPELVITRATSPLSEYRAHFADDTVDDVLFRIEALGAMPDRIRIAALTSYDGERYRALDVESSTADARFTRVPSRLTAPAGEEIDVRITIETLGGIWMPTVGHLEEVTFEGPDATALQDAFYYNKATAAAVETAGAGLAPGDGYVLEAVVPEVPELSEISAPGAPGLDFDVPVSLAGWLDEQGVSADGAGLAEAISRLRARGYLSHSLAAPADAAPAWASDLGDYIFQPSAAGHSLARIDALFRQLLDRSADAAPDGPDASLVAGVGDDEQFAVAGALIAQQLGFPSRVVVGVRLAPEAGVVTCPEGACRGRDLSAWIEVQSADGVWVPVDVTPQHEEPIDSDARRQRDPENVTEVRPETAEEISAPDPAQRDTVNDEAPEDVPLDFSAFWAVMRVVAVVGLALAVGLGPFLVVVGAKAARRRSRRRNGDAANRVVGGWDEYVDAAVDHGRPAPRAETRTELASQYATPRAATMASSADRAVFSGEPLTEQESLEFWALVDEERDRFREEASVWRRLVAAVSLKSFVRWMAADPVRGRTPSAVRSERRTRRRTGDVARAS
ncbi:MAG TPA: transglutaminase-like domain-containing protein [Microbacterium sp.]|nr:transglutaminase-like domain-containing protein [Microbacterium sp.]